MLRIVFFRLSPKYMELDQFDYQDAAVGVWEGAAKFYKNKYHVWTEHAAFLTYV